MRHPGETEEYISSLFASETEAHKHTSEALKHAYPKLYPIQLGPLEGKILQLLIRLAGAKKVVEVGSLAGYSALWIAEALPEDGVVYAINKDPKHHALLEGNIKKSDHARKIIPCLGDAKQVLETLNEKAPLDMIFIDADKSAYVAYLDWAEKHIRKGGLIVGDNTLLFGHACQDVPPEGERAPSKTAWRVMREFNERLANAEKYTSILLPTEEGMTVAVKEF